MTRRCLNWVVSQKEGQVGRENWVSSDRGRRMIGQENWVSSYRSQRMIGRENWVSSDRGGGMMRYGVFK